MKFINRSAILQGYRGSFFESAHCTKLVHGAQAKFARREPKIGRKSRLSQYSIPGFDPSGRAATGLHEGPDPSVRDACFVVTSDSHPHVLPMYAPVRALAPPRTHRLLDGQVSQIDTTLRTDHGRRHRSLTRRRARMIDGKIIIGTEKLDGEQQVLSRFSRTSQGRRRTR